MDQRRRSSDAPSRHRASMRNFYAAALSAGERIELEEAEKLENLDQEIAVLRVRLKTALDEHPEDHALLVRGMGLLVKAVSAQYRLSPRASKDLADNLGVILNRFGDLVLPADR
jgi:hypothetical protein